MKRSIFTLIALLTVFGLSAGKYVRYYMKDGSFHGFYAALAPTVSHESQLLVSSFDLNGRDHSIPLNSIDRIVIEDANVSESFAGDYRVYEKNDPNGDFKKVIVDNRACVLASRNGDFGANDTILYASDYNNEHVLFFTDSVGHVKIMFDGKSLYRFIRTADSVTVLELPQEGGVIEHVLSSADVNRAPELSFRKLGLYMTGLNALIHNYMEVAHDPEAHNQMLIVDGLVLAVDYASFVAATGALLTEGNWADFLTNLQGLRGSIDTLLNDMFPEAETMRRYKDFYQKKYGITVTANPATDVTSTSAKLCGTFSADNGINGKLSFAFHKLLDSTPWETVIPSVKEIAPHSYSLSASVDLLQPRTDYLYLVEYECVVDGLTFNFVSDPIDFRTLTPQAVTLGVESKDSNSARVKCSFNNLPQDVVCGIQYGYAGSSKVALASVQEAPQIVSLTGLLPNTRYDYRAFIQYNGEYYYGETYSFTTEHAVASNELCEVIGYDFNVIASTTYDIASGGFDGSVNPILKANLKFNIPLETSVNTTYVATCDDKEYPIEARGDSFYITALEWNLKSCDLPYEYDIDTNEVSIYLDKRISVIQIDENGNRKMILYFHTDGAHSPSVKPQGSSTFDEYVAPIKVVVTPSYKYGNISLGSENYPKDFVMNFDVSVDGLLAYYVCSNRIPGWTDYMVDTDSPFLIDFVRNDSGFTLTYGYENKYSYRSSNRIQLGSNYFTSSEFIDVYGYDEKGNEISRWRRRGKFQDTVGCFNDKQRKFTFPGQKCIVNFYQDWLHNISGGPYYDPGDMMYDSFEITDVPAAIL